MIGTKIYKTHKELFSYSRSSQFSTGISFSGSIADILPNIIGRVPSSAVQSTDYPGDSLSQCVRQLGLSGSFSEPSSALVGPHSHPEKGPLL